MDPEKRCVSSSVLILTHGITQRASESYVTQKCVQVEQDKRTLHQNDNIKRLTLKTSMTNKNYR